MASSGSPPPPPPSQSPSSPTDQKTYLTWSNFFSILTSRASPSLQKSYFDERDLLNETADCTRCNSDVAFLFRASPLITFLSHNISLLSPSAPLSPKNIHCRRCESGIQSGGFSPQHGILLCANEFRSRGHLEDTLAHEMIHAYDYLRFKLDPEDLRHAACMEIRASMLSGECRFTREFFSRGQWNLTQQLQECVRRRAVLSVKARKACGGNEEVARRVVDEVWGSCFGDTRPFDEIYK